MTNYAPEETTCPECGKQNIKISGPAEVYVELFYNDGEFYDSETGDIFGFLETADHECRTCGHMWTTHTKQEENG